MMTGNEAPWNGNIAEERSNNNGATRAGARDFDRRHAGRKTSDGFVEDAEPVRMVHHPSPYADAPSLFDLYVQASWPAKGATRFGAEVFRGGAVNSEVLPMDLPVGPDYVLGPGDSLSIDLWGGVSQRLFRVVDREGRLVLPEAGPLLVAGKSLGEVQEAVQRVLRTQFRNVSADVSLLKLRTVRVYVVGEVASPGAYDVSSLSTPLLSESWQRRIVHISPYYMHKYEETHLVGARELQELFPRARVVSTGFPLVGTSLVAMRSE